MNKNMRTLDSIPENSEIEELEEKWISKKKHELLKAKYKCLKKLFQVYDASIVTLLPESYDGNTSITVKDGGDIVNNASRHRKKSQTTKTNAKVDTNELNINYNKDSTKLSSVATVTSDFVLKPYTRSVVSDKSVSAIDKESICSQDDRKSTPFRNECDTQTTLEFKRQKLTKLQIFFVKIFGPRRDRSKLSKEIILSASDRDISYNCFGEKRRKRDINLRRRRSRKMDSESDLKAGKTSELLSHLQSVQKSCLMDNTARPCPISGCTTMCYGIINYNDHLNLCHFPERKHICHFCHAGLTSDTELEKHEHNHIGIETIKNYLNASANEGTSKSLPDEKLKKLLSFIDKVSISEKSVCEESSSRRFGRDLAAKWSRHNVQEKLNLTKNNEICANCEICDNRRQQNFGSKLNDKYFKFHSCTGVMTPAKTPSKLTNDVSNNFQNGGHRKQNGLLSDDELSMRKNRVFRQNDAISITTKSSAMSRTTYDDVSCDPSTNIVYYTSTESVQQKHSAISNLAQKVKSGFNHYKWVPETKIVRV